MSCYFRHAFAVTLALIFTGYVNASPDKQDQEKVMIPVSSSPTFTFKIPMRSRVDFFLLTNKNTKVSDNIAAQITLSDQDCALGHQVSINYEKNTKDILTTYFPKEIPWDSTYELTIKQDKKTKTITIMLNDEIISITPRKKAEFIYLMSMPKIINMLDIEQHKQ